VNKNSDNFGNMLDQFLIPENGGVGSIRFVIALLVFEILGCTYPPPWPFSVYETLGSLRVKPNTESTIQLLMEFKVMNHSYIANRRVERYDYQRKVDWTGPGPTDTEPSTLVALFLTRTI
jgi:hypothetical protein